MGRGKVSLHASYWILNSPRSLTDAAIWLVKNDRLQKPVQRCTIHNTACEAFVKGAFLELSVNADSSFELKEEQKIAKNCLRAGRNVFAVIPTGFGKSFIFQQFCAVIEQEKISEGLHPNSVILVICPFKSLVEDQIKVRQYLGLTCASLQDVNNLFWRQSAATSICICREGTWQWLQGDPERQIFQGSPASRINSGRRITHCGDLDAQNDCSLILTGIL